MKQKNSFANGAKGANSTVENEKEKKNTIGGDPKICAPKVGKVNELLERRQLGRKMKREDDRGIYKIELDTISCYNVNYTAESSFAANIKNRLPQPGFRCLRHQIGKNFFGPRRDGAADN